MGCSQAPQDVDARAARLEQLEARCTTGVSTNLVLDVVGFYK